MGFSVHLEEDLLKRLDRIARQTSRRRNALIREAVASYLERQERRAWPDVVMEFKGESDAPRFEATRSELSEPREPFG